MTLFTSQSAAMFYDKLFSSLDFTLPRAATGRRGFPKEAMVCAFIVMKCEGFSQITDLADYLDNNRLIAHYCGFNIMEPLPSYWTYDRCLRQLNNGALKSIMANLGRKLYELGVVDASFVGLDSTPVMANTKQNNPKSFAKNKFSKENHPKSDPDCALGVHSASNQHNERRYEFYWGYKSHVLVDCISGLPLYELTTPGNVADSSVAAEILAKADRVISLKECTFLADKGYDVKSIYNTVKRSMRARRLSPSIHAARKPWKRFLPVIRSARLGLPCTRTARRPTMGVPGRNTAVLSASLRLVFAPAATKTGTMGRKAGAARNTGPFPMTNRLSIDRSCLCFKRTYALRTECERYNSRFKSTGQERLWVRSGASAANLNTLAHTPALAVALPFCMVLTPAAHPNHSGEALKVCSHTAFFARFSIGLAIYALFLFAG